MSDEWLLLQYESMSDVVGILDSALLLGNELVPQYRAVHVANRAMIAHLAIERGFKASLVKAGIPYSTRSRKGHDLPYLYELTKQIEGGEWANSLGQAYKDAVRFYEYDVEMIPHLETLETYLAKVGTNGAFEEFRYWLTDHSAPDGAPGTGVILDISLSLHREILDALWPLFAFGQLRLVSERVEEAIARGLQWVLAYSPGTPSEEISASLMRWLRTKPSFQAALRDAVQVDYLVEGLGDCERMKLRSVFEGFNKTDGLHRSRPPSADPAVLFFMRTCQDLPPDFPVEHPDIDVEVDWLGDGQLRGSISSPTGEQLGFISKDAQGRWHVDAIGGRCRVASTKSLEDAKRWLIAQHCDRATMTVYDQPPRDVSIFSPDSALSWRRGLPRSTAHVDESQEFELVFWDECHGISPGQRLLVQRYFDVDREVGEKLEGDVVGVDRHRVRVVGNRMIAPLEPT